MVRLIQVARPRASPTRPLRVKEGGRQAVGLPDGQQQVLHQEDQDTDSPGPRHRWDPDQPDAGNGKTQGSHQVAESGQTPGPGRPDPGRQGKKPHAAVKILVLKGIEDIEAHNQKSTAPAKTRTERPGSLRTASQPPIGAKPRLGAKTRWEPVVNRLVKEYPRITRRTTGDKARQVRLSSATTPTKRTTLTPINRMVAGRLILPSRARPGRRCGDWRRRCGHPPGG